MSDDGLGDAFEDALETMSGDPTPGIGRADQNLGERVMDEAYRLDPTISGGLAEGGQIFHSATSAISDMTNDDPRVVVDDAARGMQQVTDGDPRDTWNAISRQTTSAVPEPLRGVVDESGEAVVTIGQLGVDVLGSTSPAGPLSGAVDVVEHARDAYNENERDRDIFAERGIPGPVDPNAPPTRGAEGNAEPPSLDAIHGDVISSPDDWSGDADPTGDALMGTDVTEVLTSPDASSYDVDSSSDESTSSADPSSYDGLPSSDDSTSSVAPLSYDTSSSYDNGDSYDTSASYDAPASDDAPAYDPTSSYDSSSDGTGSWGSDDSGF